MEPHGINYACAFVYLEHGRESACCISIVITFVSKYILIIMNIIIINIKAIDIIYYDKHWNTEWLTQ